MTYALDIETTSLDPSHLEYALQPWRVKEQLAEITHYQWFYKSLDLIPGSNDLAHLKYMIEDRLNGQYVWTWFGIFDIAFIIATGIDCSRIKWMDAMSAFKWVIRSQLTDPPYGGERFSWSLENAADRLLNAWFYYDEYMYLKANIQNDPEYWKRRCRLDSEATYLIGNLCYNQLTEQQKKGFLIEQEALFPVALAWINGCRYDMRNSEALADKIKDEQSKCLRKISGNTVGLIDAIFWDRWATILGSPQKLAILLHDTWGIPFDENSKTATGQRSVNKAALQFLIEKHSKQFPQLLAIKKFRELKSLNDKFVKNPWKVFNYLKSDIFHHNFKINSTYTGRCTVASKSESKLG